ncbi:MAG: hypothetical protein JST62_05880 [Bacteroidetes bacterium]|nr:hypothetical protein [Bacteroidota bacterium]
MIKNLISLEEEDEISTHIFKIEQQTLPTALENIIIDLKQKSYSKAIIAIEAFINQHSNLTIYTDPEIEGLKM